MNTLGLWVVAGCVPVTLFALLGVIVHAVARLRGPAVGAMAAATTLVILTGVSLLTLSSWPRWWTLAVPIAWLAEQSPAVATNTADEANTPESLRDAQMTADAISPNGLAADGSSPPLMPLSSSRQPLEVVHSSRLPRAGVASTWHWPGVIGTIGIVFATGVSVALIRFLLGLWMVSRYRACGVVITEPALLTQARQIASDLGLDRPVELRQSRDLGSPATVGWWRPLVLLPVGWETWSDEERRVVLAHEIAHIARGDFPVWLLAQVSLAMHFYHPLVHWLVRRLRLEQELAADILGAELAGGRELYLVTLTQMVLRKDARRTSWAAQPFLPSRGTFVRRIEMLSDNKSLGHAPWSRPSAAALIVMMALIGVASAGVRMPSGERKPMETPKPVGNKTSVVEAKNTEQSLTLDELRPIIVDHFRSIRSLYAAYTRTDPPEFGGHSHDNVWAEQGFKLVRYDLPGKHTIGYAHSYDGKSTYNGSFQGDKPVAQQVRPELGPEMHAGLQSTLLGWLHFGGHRETIADVIRTPSAKLTETKQADGTKRLTIEVTGYNNPGNRVGALNATIVLDPEHGYLPKSIAWHTVATPTWQFAYEVDEFQKVRDAATGEDRWFPIRGRYKQKTPERGEQTFTTVITKLQINENLPDDLFVLRSSSPTVAPGQEQQAQSDFEKAYHLNPDQLVRRVKPPYLPGRMAHLKKWWKDAFEQAPYETTGTFLPTVFPERDGQLGKPGFRFTSDVSQTRIPARELLNSVGAELKLVPREIEDPGKLLESTVDGDFVIRGDAPAEQVIAALGQLLKAECGIAVTLELRHVEHPVITITGKIQSPFVIEPKTVVELFTETPQPGVGANEVGTFPEFLKAVGKSIDPQRRIVNEVENSPYRQEKISWHRAAGTEKDDKAVLGEKDARAVLDHLEKQSGLKFKLESRKFPTIYVERSD